MTRDTRETLTSLAIVAVVVLLIIYLVHANNNYCRTHDCQHNAQTQTEPIPGSLGTPGGLMPPTQPGNSMWHVYYGH